MLDDEKQELLALEEERHYRAARESLEYFAETVEIPMVPSEGEEDDAYPVRIKLADHHRLLLRSAQDLLTGKLQVDGVMAFLPPGSAKSTFLSVVTEAWALGYFPRPYEIIGTSYNDDHAHKFSGRIKKIIQTETYRRIMNAATVSDAVEAWSLDNDNAYRSAGIRGGIVGNRANAVIIDDPIKDRVDADSPVIRDRVWEAYLDVIDSRLKPGGKLFLIMTRWHEDDLAGRLLGEGWKGQSGIWKTTDGRTWMVINCPLLAEHRDDPLGRKIGGLLWPEYFKMEDAKRRQTLGGRTWSSLYQQRPTANEGAILTRSWWREWKKKDKKGEPEPPNCEYIFLAYDTALEAQEENDFSAMTAWGIFRSPVDDVRMGGRVIRQGQECYHAILLGAWQDRVPAVDLMRQIKAHIKVWPDVDMILIEQKASGIQLIQEMKRMRWPVKGVQPRTGSGGKMSGKVPRAHAVSLVLEQGSIWFVPGAMTHKVLDECAAFPYGRHDDLVDTVLYALSFFRDGYFFQTPSDYEDKDEATLNDMKTYEELRTMRNRRSYDGGTFEFEDNGLEPSPFAKRSGYGQL